MRYRKYLSFIPTLLIIILGVGLTSADEWINIWYGHPDGSPIEARIGELVDIDVYIQTSDTIYVGDAHICLGTSDSYIDSLLSQYYAEFYYPINQWDTAYFFEPFGSPPNPAGWSSQSLIATPELRPPFDSPPLSFEEPTLAMTLVVKTANDPSLIGDTAYCIGTGLHPYIGPSAFGDTMGNAIPLTENYSPIFFEPGTGIKEIEHGLPEYYNINQNYPNPFNAATSISYSIPEDTFVTIEIYNILGHKVAILVNTYQPAGKHEVIWDANALSSGIYFYRFTAGDFTASEKMLLLK